MAGETSRGWAARAAAMLALASLCPACDRGEPSDGPSAPEPGAAEVAPAQPPPAVENAWSRCADLGGRPAPRPDAPPVVMVVVDTLRADHLGTYGYPRPTSARIDALAEESVVFEQAMAPAPWTSPSVAGLLTGVHPAAMGYEHDPMPIPNELSTLAEELRCRGYVTGGVVSNTFITDRYLFHRGFDRWDQSNAGDRDHVSSPSVTSIAEGFVGELAGGDRPLFLLAHYFDPHFHYIEHEGHIFSSGYAGPVSKVEGEVEALLGFAAAGKLDDEDRQNLHDRYDSEISFTDASIGELFDHLRAAGIYDDALIIVVSDHGEMFDEGPTHWIGHSIHLTQSLLHVPLIIRLPRASRRERIGRRVGIVGVYESVMSIVDGHAPLEGSLLGLAPQGAPLFARTRRYNQLDAILQGDWKLVYRPGGFQPELYDLGQTPLDAENLFAAHQERALELGLALREWDRQSAASSSRLEERRAPTLSAEEIERLEALGYIH